MPTKEQLIFRAKFAIFAIAMEKVVADRQPPIESCIERERALNPNWTDKDSKHLSGIMEEWPRDCNKSLEEARARLRALNPRIEKIYWRSILRRMNSSMTRTQPLVTVTPPPIETVLKQMGIDENDPKMIKFLEISQMRHARTTSAEDREEYSRLWRDLIDKARMIKFKSLHPISPSNPPMPKYPPMQK